ncbi:nicotinamide riboside kinase 1 [Puma concolor]|uniref:Nicotinamide riboside kinase 1 n=1 Tax=Puma concolor TaxID=9696 RepID=A0A6P6IGQ5_PUMCO|nr:nicotinamide riboside kinase 1 [Puma concolor]
MHLSGHSCPEVGMHNLQKHLPNCSIVSQDDFFKPESEIEIDANGFLQYDVLEALNMEKMMSTISCWMESQGQSLASTDSGSAEEIPILIIEGFLLFNYKPLDTLWNRSYFLTIPYEECKRRRSTRVYEPPDTPGYFDGHVWPMYLKHRREMEKITWEIVRNKSGIGNEGYGCLLSGYECLLSGYECLLSGYGSSYPCSEWDFVSIAEGTRSSILKGANLLKSSLFCA